MRRFKKIYIEITNICNLNCSFCPKNARLKRYMTVAEFDKITTDILPLTDTVCLHLMGEPLLHPDIEKIFEICKQKKLKIFLTTNGTLLKQNLELLKMGYCDKIFISLHSYEANTQVLSLDEYLENVFYSCKEISENSNTFIEFRLWNKSNDKNAKNQLNDEIIHRACEYYKTNLKIKTEDKYFKLLDNIALGFENVFMWPINTINGKQNDVKFCYALRTHFGILCDGTVVACCLDSEGKLSLGNILKQDINDILSCPRAKNIYDGFTNRHICEEFCKSCIYTNKLIQNK